MLGYEVMVDENETVGLHAKHAYRQKIFKYAFNYRPPKGGWL